MSIKAATPMCLLLLFACPGQAQTIWGPPGPGQRPSPLANRGAGADREALDMRVTTARFIAKDAEAKLGHGAIEVQSMAGDNLAGADKPVFEAALVDQLAKAGYETAAPDPKNGQVAVLEISRSVAVPEETKRAPVSGEAMMGVSNHGTSMGLAVNIDLRKARKAVLATRILVRIKDRASGATLWEGRASMDTREGDPKWRDEAIAAHLTETLFAGFAKPGQARVVTMETP